eukprot:334499-Prorocentrum_lima.AAC.1
MDHESTIAKQKSQGTLLARQRARLPDHESQVNRLAADQEAHLLQGPMKKSLQEWWKAGTTKARLL